MKIMAIDPGTTQSAWVQYDTHLRRSVLAHKWDNEDLLRYLRNKMGSARTECAELVVEEIASYGMPVGRDVFHTCFWTGRFIEAWAGKFTLITRMKIKIALCHNARAKDGNIRQALIDRIGPQGTKKNPGPTYGISGDMWSALAVAVAYADPASELQPSLLPAGQ